jgi:hypothetical protein
MKGTDFPKILVDPRARSNAHRHHATLSAFSEADEHGPALEVNVIESKIGELEATDARRIEGLEDGAVSQPHRGRHVDPVQEIIDFCRGEDAMGKTALALRELDLGCRILEHEVSLREPPKKDGDPDEVTALRPS